MLRKILIVAAIIVAVLLAVMIYLHSSDDRYAPARAQFPDSSMSPSTGASPGGQPWEVQPQGTLIRFLRDERAANNRVAVLAEDLMYCYPPTGDVIIVPVGYVTDFASVPGGLDRFLQEYGQSIEAAIIHDWLYAVGEPRRKQFADDLFRYALREQGVSLSDRWLKWLGVTAGGERAYGRNSEWDERFSDPGGLGQVPPPFQRRTSAVVTRVEDCKAIDSVVAARAIVSQFGSATWPRP